MVSIIFIIWSIGSAVAYFATRQVRNGERDWGDIAIPIIFGWLLPITYLAWVALNKIKSKPPKWL